MIGSVTDAQQQLAAMAARREQVSKGYAERGSREGPAEPVEPGQACEPGHFSRPYLAEGHAAPSPGYEGPRANPVPQPYGRGYPVQVELPGTTLAAHIHPAVAGHFTLGSPSELR